MIVAPVTVWIKNVNDHAIHGDAPSPVASSPSVAGTALTPLLVSLSSGLRGDLNYPSRPPLMHASGNASSVVIVDTYCNLAAAAALAPPPRPDPAALPKRMARMRLEVLGDRKLRAARFLMEMAVAGDRPGDDGAAAEPPRRVPVSKIRRILALLTVVFRPPGPRPLGNVSRPATGAGAVAGAGAGAGASAETEVARVGSAVPTQASPGRSFGPYPLLQQPQSPLRMLRDVLPLMRPVYSLLGEALLGEPGPARQLGRHSLAAAAALSIAGLELIPPAATEARSSAEAARPDAGGGRHGVVGAAGVAAEERAGPATERRLADCFADVVVLAVSTKLATFLTAVGGDVGVDGSGAGSQHGSGGDNFDDGSAALDELGPRESELEALILELGAWESNGSSRGWPHHLLRPAEDPSASKAPRVGGKRDGNGDSGTPLSALLEEADEMVEAFLSVTAGRSGRALLLRVRGALVPRIEACKLLLSGEGRTAVSGAAPQR